MKTSKKTGLEHQPQLHGSEWVGGRFAAPFFVTEGGPYRPEIVLWLELPEGFIVGVSLGDPKAPEVPFAETLRQAMNAPAAGRPRRPRRVRVENEELAAELREAFPEIPVTTAPTPELAEVMEDFARFGPGAGEEKASYFEGGRVSPEAVQDLFRAGRALHALAPWKSAEDHQVLRVDIPALDVHGWCLSIIGALGESRGVLLFPSLQAYEAFGHMGESPLPEEGPFDIGSSVLSLTFERGADLPEGMRREAARHGWKVAGPDAYPTVERRERDGFPRPLTERDVRIAASCATSLSAFLMKHGSIFRKSSFEPICESWLNDDDLEVRFTVPYGADHLFEVNQAHPASAGRHVGGRPKAPRNAPCPCGSGKKYKKCCLGKDEAAAAEENHTASLHAADRRLAEELVRFALRRFGDRWSIETEEFADADEAVGLAVPWSLFSFTVDGKTVAEWFREERGARLSFEDRAILDGEGRAWLSIWEAVDVEPGASVRVRDLLSGEERLVMERSGTEELAVRDTLLARIVDHGRISLFSGLHPRLLPPRDAAAVVEKVRKRLRRKGEVPADRLRAEKIGRYMIRCWEEAAEDLDHRFSVPPELRNTDGDELLLTVDHFEFDPGGRAEIEERLCDLEDVEPPDPDDPEDAYVFHRAGARKDETILIGRAVLSKGKLRLETNSVKRADSLRARIEEASGGLLRHKVREHSDPVALLKEAERKSPKTQPPPIPENAVILREFKERHYGGWIDESLPALEGKSPREAIGTKEGRREVDLLLREMENFENRLPEAERYDFIKIRRRLGLEG
ncbi:MAG: SEC-C metal-binding domain-containing protein [Candidatus Eisenbacteria bacterium]